MSKDTYFFFLGWFGKLFFSSIVVELFIRPWTKKLNRSFYHWLSHRPELTLAIVHHLDGHHGRSYQCQTCLTP